MKHIRPWRLFNRLNGNRDVTFHIPAISGGDSLTVSSLETLILVAAARIANVKSILEIGTSIGYNAYNLAKNLSAEITTVDIKNRSPRIFDHTPYRDRINAVVCDSALFEPRPFDMVFIDGDHSLEAVARDTELAMNCNPKVIAWHDYNNPDDKDNIKPYLDYLDKDLIHIEDSWMVLWFRDIKF